MPNLTLDPRWSVVLTHRPSSSIPLCLLAHRDRLLFARYMALTGRMGDWKIDREAEGRLVGVGSTTAGSGSG